MAAADRLAEVAVEAAEVEAVVVDTPLPRLPSTLLPLLPTFPRQPLSTHPLLREATLAPEAPEATDLGSVAESEAATLAPPAVATEATQVELEADTPVPAESEAVTGMLEADPVATFRAELP